MEKKVWFSNFISLDRFIYIEKISFHQKRPRLEKMAILYNGYMTIQKPNAIDHLKSERVLNSSPHRMSNIWNARNVS